MRLLNIVQEILDEKYISKGNLMIEPEAGMRIEIKGEDFLCYKFGVDVHKEFLNHFSDSSGLKKMADYIIFQQVKEQLLILQVELKKGESSKNTNANKKASIQLKACDEFSRYIIRTIERIGKGLSEKDCKFFKIRISEGDIKRFKSKTKPTDCIHTIEENYFSYRSEIFDLIRFSKI